MRAAPTYLAPQQLHAIDEAMRAAITRTCNITLSNDSWMQASLPIRMGGIGVRRMKDVALPAFTSSMSATQDLVRQINGHSGDDEPHLLSAALNAFRDYQCPDYDSNPSTETPISQRQLDEAACRRRLEALLERNNQVHRARLLAAAAPHSGAWLDAIPVESLGPLLPDEAMRSPPRIPGLPATPMQMWSYGRQPWPPSALLSPRPWQITSPRLPQRHYPPQPGRSRSTSTTGATRTRSG